MSIAIALFSLWYLSFPARATAPQAPILPKEGSLSFVQGNSLYWANGAITDPILLHLWDSSWQYGNYYEVKRIAICESNLNPKAIGDLGLAFNIFQWHQESWDLYNKLFETNLDIYSWQDQIEMTLKVIKEKGYKDWVNCAYKTLGIRY